MKTRILFVAALCTSMVVGALRLFHGAVVPSGVAVGVVAGVIGARVVVVVRARVRRLRSWPRPGVADLPAGPRRVLLSETGLAGPR